MSLIIPIRKDAEENQNPLDNLEDILEASGYVYERIGMNRLHFSCSGKQSGYDIMLERNNDANIIKLTLVMASTKSIDRNHLDNAVFHANESAWHGFFMVDGVGNSIFKTFIQCDELSPEVTLFLIEDMIDKATGEADRFYISLSLSSNDQSDNLFPVDSDEIENLNLMFSDIKGNA